MRRRFSLLPVSLACLGLAGPAAADPRLDVIEPLPGHFQIQVHGISGDGCAVVGESDYEAWRWREGVTSPLVAPPGNNPSVAYAITPDGQTVVGFAGLAFRLDGDELTLLQIPGTGGPPHEARAVSADGAAIGGCVHATPTGMHCDWPFHWRDGVGTLLQGPGGGIPFGGVSAFSADGEIAGGTANGQAVLWRPAAGTVQALGALPGHTQSSVRGLSADGAVAVGRSAASVGSARAFRWDGSAMQDLGPLTSEATAVSANGQVLIGNGPQGPFLWDAAHGARLLADVLRDDYGLDLGGFDLGTAMALSPDGLSFAGTGGDENGNARGWRARLHDERCSPDPHITNVFAGYAGEPPIDEVFAIGVDSQQRVHLSARRTQNLVRIDPANPVNPPETLLDFGVAGPDPHGVAPAPLEIGPDDTVYVGDIERRQLLRLSSAGASEVVLDGSGYPAVPPWTSDQVLTRPVRIAIATDGTLFVAAQARLLRIDPDGSVHTLMDAAQATRLASGSEPSPYGGAALLEQVARGPDGRLYVMLAYATLLALDPDSGAVLEVMRDIGWAAGIAGDSAGGVWLYGSRLARVEAGGTLRIVLDEEQLPDGRGGVVPNVYDVVTDAHGNLYYQTGASAIVRVSPDGFAKTVLRSDSLDETGAPIGAFWGPLFVSDDMLYVGHDPSDIELYPCDVNVEPWSWCEAVYPVPPRVLRVALPAAACANGLDDDGDGAADYPADAGCVSPEDDGERALARVCDNGRDEDHDGAADYPADPGCASPVAANEATECDDGVDNDGDGAVDWDGHFDELSGETAPPDPQCGGDPMRVIEHPMYCGLGFEVALVLPVLALARRRRRRAASRRRAKVRETTLPA